MNWIKITNKQPTLGEKVLFWDSRNQMSVGSLWELKSWCDAENGLPKIHIKFQFTVEAHCCIEFPSDLSDVIFWMPLPEPPANKDSD